MSTPSTWHVPWILRHEASGQSTSPLGKRALLSLNNGIQLNYGLFICRFIFSLPKVTPTHTHTHRVYESLIPQTRAYVKNKREVRNLINLIYI